MLGEGVDWTQLSLRCSVGERPSSKHPAFAENQPLPLLLQLLNHMDGTGPPPMAKENIADIPTVTEISAYPKSQLTSTLLSLLVKSNICICRWKYRAQCAKRIHPVPSAGR